MSSPERRGTAIRWVVAVVLGAIGFLPIVNWIPGGHEAPWYGAMLSGWLRDGLLILGIGVLLGMASRQWPALWRPDGFRGVIQRAEAHPTRTALGLAIVALGICSLVAWMVFDARPLLIDEIIQVWQARVLAGGHLWLPTPPNPEFSSATHLVDLAGKRFAQFPIGGPAMLAFGSLLHAEWLVGPVFAGISVLLACRLFRRVEPSPGVALGASVLLALAPFAVFMAGSHMNHVPTLTWLLVAMLGLSRLQGPTAFRPVDGFLAGFGLGMAATIRPIDAMAFAAPAGIWMVLEAWRTRRVVPLTMAGLGLAIPLGLLLMVNAGTTGHPLLFGYQVMWGDAVGLGFHATPWGAPHTPRAGLELINLYFLRLQGYLFESPFPALLPGAVALLLTRRFSAFDRYLLAAGGLLCALYAAYWHDGFYLGPRYMYSLLPLLVLWTARAVPACRAALPPQAFRILSFAAVASVPLALVTGVPLRVLEYANQLDASRFDHDAAARRAGIRGALVLVRESWGAEVLVRIWALGISRGDAEFIYPRVDTCQLDLLVTDLEAQRAEPAQALALLRAATADSGRLYRSTLSPDQSERMRPGLTYPTRCQERLRQDAEGFTLFPPALLAGRDGNVYRRDLGEDDARILAEYPGRDVYLLRPNGPEIGRPPEFHPISRAMLLRTEPEGH